MPRLADVRGQVVAALDDHYRSPPKPGGLESADEGRFEAIARVAIGLVADPRTTDSALITLRDAGLLDADSLGKASPAELEDVLKASRVRLAARSLGPLRRLARWVAGGGLGDEAEPPSTETIREGLRAIHGVGPATADALLLFALGRPAYPVDRATYRVLVRHGWIDPTADYEEARDSAETLAPDDAGGLARVALAMTRLGRDFCKPGQPRCERCPLRPWLPEGGPREAE